MQLILGVADAAYKNKGATTTTGQVANWLEAKYHVMRTFVELHEREIGDLLSMATQVAIDNVAAGKPPKFEIGGALATVEQDFSDYLDKGEWRRTSAQPIAAVDNFKPGHKVAHSKHHRSRREFIDTGLYQASFRAWLVE